MKNEALAADDGALSVEQAVATLGELAKKKMNARDAEDSTPVEQESLVVPEADEGAAILGPTQDVLRQAQDEEEGAEAGSESEQEDPDREADDEPLDPPKFWDAKAKERFGDLPRDLQEIVIAKENERNQATAKALQESAERRKTADGEAAKFKSLAEGLDRLLPEAVKAFENRWSHIDWASVAQRQGADETLKLQHHMQAEQRDLQRLSTAKELTDGLAHARFVEEQEGLMPELAPDLADQKQGKARRQELGNFLLSLGVVPERIPHLSALEAGLAYDAMQWRNGKAKADSLVKAQKEAAPQKRLPAKPGGAPRGSTHQNRIAALSHKKHLTIDEAVELTNLKGLQ